MVRSLLIILLLCSPVLAEDKPVDLQVGQKIWFPSLPVPDKAPVTPAPPADPDAVPVLTYGQIYAVQSEVEFFLRAYPKSLVTITKPVKGPVTARGIFIVGGKIETRVLTGKYVAFVDAGEKAAGRVDLVATPVGNASEDSIVEQTIDVNTAGPRPPPKPDDPDVPDNPPVPAPTGFRVIFAEETSARYSPAHLHILHSTKIVEFLNANCAKGADGRPEWRKWDKDIVVTAKESATIAELWAAVKPKLTGLDTAPKLVVAVNGAATVMDMPGTEDETLAKLKAIAGVK